MKKKIVCLLLAALFACGVVSAEMFVVGGTLGVSSQQGVVRDIVPSFVYTNSNFSVMLDVTVGTATYYLIKEGYPLTFTIINATGDADYITNQPYIFWSVLSGAHDTIYTYFLKAPSTTGTYKFNGTYGFEGCQETVISGDYLLSVVSCSPSAEVCNNVDDDCDYFIDENLQMQCSLNHYGVCAVGIETCAAGSWYGCPAPSAEICNNLDDDCDNQLDDGLQRSCSLYYLGECAIGTEDCVGGTYSGCPLPTSESTHGCDGNDNDCDGEVDEDKNTGADTNCDGSVSMNEVLAYIYEWKIGNVTMNQVLEAIMQWKLNP